MRLDWWRQSLRAAVAFAPSCFLPAGLLGAANVVTFLGTRQLYHGMQLQEVQLEELTRVLGIGAISLLGAFLLMTWSLSTWLIRLTAFARAFLKSSGAPDDAMLKTCLSEVRGKKGFLLKLWTIASLYLLVPLFPLSLLSVVKVMSSPEFAAGALGDSPLPPWSGALVVAGMIAATALGAGYSVVVLVLSAATLSRAGETAWSAVKLSLRHAITILLATCMVLAVNTLVTSPQTVVTGGSVEDLFRQNIYGYIAWQVWFSFSSSILLPWSIIPFCDLLRGEIKKLAE